MLLEETGDNTAMYTGLEYTALNNQCIAVGDIIFGQDLRTTRK